MQDVQLTQDYVELAVASPIQEFKYESSISSFLVQNTVKQLYFHALYFILSIK